MTGSEFRAARLSPGDAGSVIRLFVRIAVDPAATRFHPHPFGTEDAIRVCNHAGLDVYAGAFLDETMVGYGMLRGWDEGFAVPALGIYLAPQARGSGIGRRFMDALHRMALERGAQRVMLKVYPDNKAAVALYRRIGYVFHGETKGQLVGHIDLPHPGAGPESALTRKEHE